VPRLVVHGERDTNVPIAQAPLIMLTLPELGRSVESVSYAVRARG
jgi:dipeptidyl aminopeptidase/acylaminoacyl peptidase